MRRCLDELVARTPSSGCLQAFVQGCSRAAAVSPDTGRDSWTPRCDAALLVYASSRAQRRLGSAAAQELPQHVQRPARRQYRWLRNHHLWANGMDPLTLFVAGDSTRAWRALTL